MTDAEFAAQEVRDQLKSRRTYKEQTVYQTRSQFYNRNTQFYNRLEFHSFTLGETFEN